MRAQHSSLIGVTGTCTILARVQWGPSHCLCGSLTDCCSCLQPRAEASYETLLWCCPHCKEGSVVMTVCGSQVSNFMHALTVCINE